MIEVECGIDGKPAVIYNPDNRAEVNRTIARLEKTAGKGNFTVIDYDN